MLKKIFKHKYKKLRNFTQLISEADILQNSIRANSHNLTYIISKLKESKLFKLEQKTKEIYFILNLIKEQNPKILCEIGAFRGGSLCGFSNVAPENSKIISIDVNYPLKRKIAHKRFSREKQKIICINGNTQNNRTINKIRHVLGREKIDFLFIDGDHSLFGVMNDYVRFSPFVKKGGIIAFHDIHPDQLMRTGIKSSSYVGGVPLFWEAIKNSGLRVEEIIEDQEQDGYGIGIIYN